MLSWHQEEARKDLKKALNGVGTMIPRQKKRGSALLGIIAIREASASGKQRTKVGSATDSTTVAGANQSLAKPAVTRRLSARRG